MVIFPIEQRSPRPGSGKMVKAGVLSRKMEVREKDGGSEQRLKSKEGLLGCPHRKRKGSFLLHGKERPGLRHVPHLFS